MTVKCEMGDYALMVHGRVLHGAEVDGRLGEGLSEAQLMSSRVHLDAAMQLKSEQCTGKSRVILGQVELPCSRSRCGAWHVIST
jgi:hypothetical protein